MPSSTNYVNNVEDCTVHSVVGCARLAAFGVWE